MKPKEESKYYVPELSDICEGYEYETWNKKVGGEWEWVKQKVESSYDYNEVWDIYNEGKLTNIRVPYLTHEDILSEGWEYSEAWRSYMINRTWELIKWKNRQYKIIDIEEEGYTGDIKSVNELRKLQQWLKIKT